VNPFPAEYELISLFETEPTLLDSGVPWIYNQVTFETHTGEDHLHCEIEPSTRQLRVTWTRAGVEIVRLELALVAGLVVETEGVRETLVARFSESSLHDLRLQVRPHVHVSWGTEPY
jgi:hypothetical protein